MGLLQCGRPNTEWTCPLYLCPPAMAVLPRSAAGGVNPAKHFEHEQYIQYVNIYAYIDIYTIIYLLLYVTGTGYMCIYIYITYT